MTKRGKALFKAVCLGKCKSRDLPARLNLSSLAPEMNRLWEASVREIASGVVREHAALLVWERENLRLANIVEGADDEVEPSYQLAKGQQFVGTFHTHPYVTGWLGIPFSEADIASTLVHKESIAILHSGTQIYALVRTEMTPKFVEWQVVVNQALELFKKYSRFCSFPGTVFNMNIGMFEHYNLGFYSGNIAGQLILEFRP
ncbi:Mov34/MPN/PAD-1 family protein [candidate division KSB1 bacterium]|nr:Mov34/MPN/PAD-1 family protein [candidate division KSB1 bacterium]